MVVLIGHVAPCTLVGLAGSGALELGPNPSEMKLPSAAKTPTHVCYGPALIVSRAHTSNYGHYTPSRTETRRRTHSHKREIDLNFALLRRSLSHLSLRPRECENARPHAARHRTRVCAGAGGAASACASRHLVARCCGCRREARGQSLGDISRIAEAPQERASSSQSRARST